MTTTITINKPRLNTGRTGPMMDATRITLKALTTAAPATAVAVVAAPEDKRLRKENDELKAEAAALQTQLAEMQELLKKQQQQRQDEANEAARWLELDNREQWRRDWEAWKARITAELAEEELELAAIHRGYHRTTTVVAITSGGIGILDRVR